MNKSEILEVINKQISEINLIGGSQTTVESVNEIISSLGGDQFATAGVSDVAPTMYYITLLSIKKMYE